MADLFRTRLLSTWLVIATVDGVFASALNIFAYGSTATRLWQGVAATILGPASFEGGGRSVMIGLLLHLGVALVWSTVFLTLMSQSPWLRRTVSTPGGVLAVAAVYGPAIWMVMSLGVIPLFTGRPPTIGARWWVQLAGHIGFVALPIVVMSSRGRVPAAEGLSPSRLDGL